MGLPVVLVTGASGFIGTYLLDYLLQRNYAVVGLTRQKNQRSAHDHLRWIHRLDELSGQNIDYVINLAGESIGQGRWTARRKQKLIHSRVETTYQLYRFLEQQQIYPKRIISGSAVGYYGIDETEQWYEYCDEKAPAQTIFMSELCQLWEQAALSFPLQKTRIIRLGVVFAQQGGILPQMLLPVKMNMVGRIGHGRQPVAWVHIEDVLRAIEFLMLQDTQSYIFNVVTPQKTTQAEFARTAADVLGRKPFFFLPDFVLKLLLGEQSQLVLNGQFVQPAALRAEGFEFQHTDLKACLSQFSGGDEQTVFSLSGLYAAA